MRVMRIQIDDDQHEVRSVGRLFAEAKQLSLVDVVEAEAVIVLQGGILATDSIHKRNKLAPGCSDPDPNDEFRTSPNPDTLRFRDARAR